MRTVRWTATLMSVAVTLTAHAADKDPRNFEGTWQQLPDPSSRMGFGVDLPYTPRAQNLTADRLDLFKQGKPVANPHLTCRPTGIAGIVKGSPVLILQSAQKLVFIAQEDREVRQVYLDQAHPNNLTPGYSGDSVAHWEGDTLVIDTIGYNGKGWLDEFGNGHSERMHLVERLIQSADGNTITNVMTFTDPAYYTKPFTKTVTWRRDVDLRLTDYDCAEDPRSDDFANFTYENDWFKPTCVRPVENGVAADKVVCAQTADFKQQEQEAIKIVNDWNVAWETGDPQKVAAYVAEDCVFRAIQDRKLHIGRAAFIDEVKMLTRGGQEKLRFVAETTYAIGGAQGTAVLQKRIDYMSGGGQERAVPLAVFFFVKNGKITEWLDIPLIDMGPPPPGNPFGAGK